MEYIEIIKLSTLFFALCISVFYDFKFGKIPNKLNISIWFIAVISTVMQKNFLNFLISFFISFLVVIVFWILKILKAGDCKLFISISCLMGYSWFFKCFAYSLISGAVIGLGFLLYKKDLINRLKRVYYYFKNLLLQKNFYPYQPKENTQKEFPFAIHIAIGSLMATFNVLNF